MIDAGEVLWQISNRNIAATKNGALGDFLNDRLWAVLIFVERPNQIVTVFGLAPLLEEQTPFRIYPWRKSALL